MDQKVKRKTELSLLCGLLGCFCFGGGDWLMLPPYFYWAYLLFRGKSHLPGWMAAFRCRKGEAGQS